MALIFSYFMIVITKEQLRIERIETEFMPQHFNI